MFLPERRNSIVSHNNIRGILVDMERETGLEPATTCLEGRDSTTELLPLDRITGQLYVITTRKTSIDVSLLIFTILYHIAREGSLNTHYIYVQK